MGRLRHAVAVAASLAAAASCALFTDFGDLSGGAGDGAAGGPCPAGAFCDDFDIDPLGARWTLLTVSAATLTLDTTTFRSAPKSMKASVDPSDATRSQASVTTKFQGPVKQMSCTFALFIDALPTTEYPIFDFHFLPPGSDDYVIAFYLEGTTSTLKRYTNVEPLEPNTSTNVVSPAPGKWVRVRYEVQATPPPRATLYFDDDLAGSLNLEDVIGTAPTPDAEIGIGESNPGSGVTVHYDDVVCAVTK